eukprot:CFRG2690T1
MNVKMVSFETWLKTHLDTVGLGDDEFVEYIVNILEEESLTRDDKVDSVTSFLESAANVPEEFSKHIMNKWDENASTENQTSTKLEETDAFSSAFKGLAVTETIDLPQDKDKPKKIFKETLSAEDRAMRQAILAQYGNVSESDEDDNSGSESVGVNANKMAVKNAERTQREESKKTHDDKVKRDKMDLAKDKESKAEKKEKRRAATVKQERRR